ncbi:hypothetical protein BHE74_00055847 [Ensete ventricosum]|nr:hypothetical protein BHE74_00055847 [Ensete ventricosum]RZS24186.1 hypothetical protein BHM03_00057228 [Ensete ventricosum]
MVLRKNATIINITREVEFPSVFRAPSLKFKILAIPKVQAHGKSYGHDFIKKCNGHKVSQSCTEVEFRTVFCAPSQKFKILVIPNAFAYGNSYEHYFMKKCDGHKLYVKSCAKSSFK